MKFHNLGTVVSFELRKTLGKPVYWIVMLAIPMFLVLIGVLVNMNNNSVSDAVDTKKSGSEYRLAYLDQSKLISPEIAKSMGFQAVTDEAAARSEVKAGKLDAVAVFPSNLLKEKTKIFAKDLGIMKNNTYGDIYYNLAKASVQSQLKDPTLAAILNTHLNVALETYNIDGRPQLSIGQMIVPGLFVVLFYMSIVLLGGQMMNITMEEKENRVSETILTLLSPKTLLIGKTLALILIGIVQMLVLAGIGIVLFKFSGQSDSFNLSMLKDMLDLDHLNLIPVFQAGLIYLLGFLMFTGCLICIGSIMPTPKDAQALFAPIIISMFIPFYLWGIIINDPHGIVSTVMSFFPLTAPITMIFRVALQNAYTWEIVLSLAIMIVTTLGTLWLGAKLFKTGSLSYDTKLNVLKLLGAKAK